MPAPSFLLTRRKRVLVMGLSAGLLTMALWLQGPVGLALECLLLTLLLLAALREALARPAPASIPPQSSELLVAAMEQSPESMALVNFGGDLLYANRTFLERSGYALNEVVGRAAREVSANGLSDLQRTQMRTVVEHGDVWRGILSNRRKDGSEIQEGVSIAPLMDEQGEIAGFFELKQDITELMQAREQLAQLVSFDTVTLLPNRAAFSQRLEELVGRQPTFPVESASWHALLLLDVDGLSSLNAAHGMDWGNELLRAVGVRLQGVLPQATCVARTGGDEFAVILCDVGASRNEARMAAYHLATELQHSLAAPLHDWQDKGAVQLTFCVGITVFPFTEPGRKRDSEDHIYRRATMALYQAKAQGKGRIHAFSEALEQSTRRKLAVEQGLYEALEHQHLRVYVQKQVDINGKVRGVEALLRWQPPGQELVSPGVFIPVAEESELIVQLGDWMLHQAVDLLACPLLRERQVSLAVNISARQFVQPDFVDKVARLLSERQIGPGRLNLEVTESMVLTQVDEAIRIMTRLNALGVQCALDDFGTGYSSLSYLHRLPIQEIKIDQSFIRHLDADGKSGALVQALLMVAKSLGLRVVAEGVEEPAQSELLRAWFPAILCQGYLFSRPMPAQQWLQELAQEAA